MQTCSQCKTISPDTVIFCPDCQADLRQLSTVAVAIQAFRQNQRVSSVRVSVYDDACPACQQVRGNYAKDLVPTLPVQGCSHPNGCRCFYDPVLTEIYP